MYGYTTFSLSIHQLMDIWVVFIFWLLWVILLWRFVYKFLCWCKFSVLFGYIPRNVVAGSYGYSTFNFLRNCQSAFQGSYTILYSHQQCTRVLISLHTHQHLLLSIFFITAILVGMKWYLIVVLICIFLMTNDVEHLFTCL